MNDTVLHVALISNMLVMAASIGTALKYYLACQELHQAVKSAAERDGSQYAQSFQAQLWQEKKVEMEKNLVAHKRAVENMTGQLAVLQDRFNGLEQAYHEARQDLNTTLLQQAQVEENKAKRKRKLNG
jgi:chromosome segregation ATPase